MRYYLSKYLPLGYSLIKKSLSMSVSSSKKYLSVKYVSIALCVFFCVAVPVIGGLTVATSGWEPVLRQWPPEAYDNAEVKILPINVNYGFDTQDLRLLVSRADYVFVGRVKQIRSTEYHLREELIGPHLGVYHLPRTHYAVTVMENIKGDLLEKVEITQLGGLSFNGKSLSFAPPGDSILREEQIYIFSAFRLENGALAISGENSHILMGKGTTRENLKHSEKVAEIRSYCENPTE